MVPEEVRWVIPGAALLPAPAASVPPAARTPPAPAVPLPSTDELPNVAGNDASARKTPAAVQPGGGAATPAAVPTGAK